MTQRSEQPPLLLPPLRCRAWMSQTGLRLNWAEEFQHLACIYSLRSFGCSWWFPVDPQRLNCSGFWASSALDSEGVVLWRLTATAGPVCQILMWHTRLSYPQRENWERGIWGGHHMTGGASAKRENALYVGPKSPRSLCERKKWGFDGKFHFSRLFTTVAETHEIIMQNSFRDREMTNTCLSQLNHTPLPLLPHQGPTLHCKFDNWVQHQVKLWVWQWANQSSMGVKQTAFPQRAQSHRGDSGLVASPI